MGAASGAERTSMVVRTVPAVMVAFLCLLAASAGLAEDPAPAEAVEPPTQPRGAVSPAGIEVLRAYVCETIEESEPAEAGTSFVPEETEGSRLCCFSEIGVPAGSDTVFHVWYWGDREMLRIPLEVRAPRWRTWSVKRVRDDWWGAWHVDITDRAGFVLMRLAFSVE
jgi:hypothetical protein